jgi:hypothetical protein
MVLIAADNLDLAVQVLRTLDASEAFSAVFQAKSFESLLVRLLPFALAGGSATVELQHSDESGSGFATVDGTTLTSTGVNPIGVQVRVRSLKRYLRLRVVGVGAPSFTGLVERFEPRRPEDQPSALWLPIVLGPPPTG